MLVDAGRLPATPLAAPLLEGADRLLLVVRPRVEELTALAHRLPHLTGLGPPPQLLLVGDRPYGPTEVTDTLGVPVLGVLAHDADAADALAAASSRRLGRSPLLRSAAGVVDQLAHSRGVADGQDVDAEAASGNGGAAVSRRRRLRVGRS